MVTGRAERPDCRIFRIATLRFAVVPSVPPRITLRLPGTRRREKRPDMLEDFRNHDPRPSQQECAWMQADPFRAIARLMALTVLAVAIATITSQSDAGTQPHAVVAKAS
jgi:hypothetical protein